MAPAQIQGEMKAINTVVPGLQIGEGLPKIAQITDRLTVVRSMTHEYPIHCCAYVMTGMPTYSIPQETNPRAPEHWPYLGSVVDYLDGRRSGQRSPLSPKDMQATAYHLLGYDESTTVPNQQGRPHLIAGDGRVRPELLG